MPLSSEVLLYNAITLFLKVRAWARPHPPSLCEDLSRPKGCLFKKKHLSRMIPFSARLFDAINFLPLSTF